MAFQPKKFDQIYAEMERFTQERLPGVTDFRVGSVVRTMYESIAYEMAVLYEQMDQVYLSAYVDTARGTELDRLVAILGIQRGLPDFAEGIVTFERDHGTEAISIPIGTLVTTKDTEKTPRKSYKTIELASLPAEQTTIEVKVQAIDRGEAETVPAEAISIMPQPIPGVKSVINKAATQFTGKRAETDDDLRRRAKSVLLASGKASRTALETALLVLPGVKEVKLVERFGADQENPIYGLIDVFVDGVDFDNQARVQTLQSQIDQVRAAGVMVRLRSAVPISLDGVFWLEVTEADPKLETSVQDAIAAHLIDLKMGQPLLFTQLMRQILGVEGVKNLEKFAIAAYTHQQRQDYQPETQRIEVEEAAKFVPRHLQIHTGSQPKPLPISVTFQATGLTPDLQKIITDQLKDFLNGFEAGASLERQAISRQIASVSGITLIPDSLKLVGHPWSFLAKVTETQIEPSIVEKVSLAEPLFAYSDWLSIIGAIRFSVSDTVTAFEREQIKQRIRDRVSAYLDQLQPEQSIDLEALKIAAQEDNVTIDPLIAEDFRGIVESESFRSVEKEKITVQPFEKSRIGHLCITNTTEQITLAISDFTLRLRLSTALVQQYTLSEEAQRALETGTELLSQLTDTPRRSPARGNPEDSTAASGVSLSEAIETMQAAITQAVTRALQSFQPDTQVVSYRKLEAIILQPLSDSPELRTVLGNTTYLVEALNYRATSIDAREQTGDRTNRRDIHIRSVERLAVTVGDILFTYQSNS